MPTLAQRVFEWPGFVATYDLFRESPAAWLTCGMTFRQEVETHVRALASARGDRVIEVACGQGSFGIEVARRIEGVHVIGLDRSRAQLRRAGDKARARRVPASGFDRLLGDALCLPFGDGTFDGALCVGGLHQIPDPARAVAEMARVLRPAGVFAGAVFVLPPAASRPIGMNAARQSDVESWLSHAGLVEIDCRRTGPIWCVFRALRTPEAASSRGHRSA